MAQNLDPDVMARRRAEVERCTHISQIFRCEERWKHEDAAAERTTQEADNQRLAQLEAQVRRLQAQVHEHDVALGLKTRSGGSLVRAIGAHLSEAKAELRSEMLRDHGVWREGETYPEHALVTHDGALWHARSATGERPGNGATNWRMMTKTR
jgi:hypothetical protein